MRSYAIWDLDNCLADDEWRIERIQWDEADVERRYAAYHAACGDDAPGNLEVFESFRRRGIQPIFLTGRPANLSEVTRQWIERHLGVAAPTLIMRNVRDRRSSVDVKREMVHWLWWYDIIPAQIVAAFDDREDIVRMYREAYLIDSAVLKIHDACAYTRPAHHHHPATKERQ